MPHFVIVVFLLTSIMLLFRTKNNSKAFSITTKSEKCVSYNYLQRKTKQHFTEQAIMDGDV